MATTPSTSRSAAGRAKVYYPTRDGRPLGETPIHRRCMVNLIDVLELWFDAEPNVYVSGNMMMYYVEGDPRKHVSPDVFVTIGIPKDKPRDIYCTWLEGGRGPDLVIEATSKKTKKEDEVKKFALYRDVMQVTEYFLFDPRGEYLKPRFKGYRLQAGEYVAIAEVNGRLPSDVLALHFEPEGQKLRLFNPANGQRLPSPEEFEHQARLRAEEEVERLRRENEELRRRQGGTRPPDEA
jgi:Uma2 family endonuclease